MRLKDIEQMQEDFLTPEIIADVMHKTPQCIRNQANSDAKALGFPISKICGRYVIPREGFLFWAKYGIKVICTNAEE